MAATWALEGQCVLAFAAPRPMSGRRRPCLVVAASYERSPVGPYVELALAEPARAGARPCIRVTTMAVTSATSCEEGRRNWGFPKQLASLHWDQQGAERCLRWDDSHVEVRATPLGPSVPMVLPGWALQERSREPVMVPLRLRGRLRLARVEIAAPPEGDLSGLDGTRPGAVLTDLRLLVGPASPTRRFSTT